MGKRKRSSQSHNNDSESHDDDDSSYVPEHADDSDNTDDLSLSSEEHSLYYHGWGRKETNSTLNIQNLIRGIKNNIRDGLSLPKDQEISADCDGYSILIIIEGEEKLCKDTKNTIKELLKFFGTEWGQITPPKAPVAMQTDPKKRKATIFGSQHVKLTSESDMSDEDCVLLRKESLVVDKPVKIAVQQNCRDKIVDGFDKKQFLVELSSNKGICIDTNKIRALPNYGTTLDILLDSCYVPEAKKHIIHIADLGTRHPSFPEESDVVCYLQDLYKIILRLRELEHVTVEVCQLDIAFNINLGPKLIRWHLQKTTTTNTKERTSSFLKSLCKTVYPLHNVDVEEGKLLSDNKQKGTISFKNDSWGTKEKIILLGNNKEEDLQSLLHEIYSCETVGEMIGNTMLRANVSDLHSIKFYSSILYSIATRIQFLLPRDWNDFNKLPDSSMRRLKDLLSTILGYTFRGITHIQEHGVLARIEFSVRPTSHSRDLRLEGHLVDHLSVMFHASNDIFNKNIVSLVVEDHEPVTETIVGLVKCVKAALVCRDSEKFKDVWNHDRQTWLRAMISLILTLSGFGHVCRTRFLRQWLSEGPVYDPMGVGDKIREGNLLNNGCSPNTCESVLPGNAKIAFVTLETILQEISVSQTGIDLMSKLISRSKDSSVRSTLQNLHLLDQLKIAENMQEKIIPAFKRVIDENDNLNQQDKGNNRQQITDTMSLEEDEPPLDEDLFEKILDENMNIQDYPDTNYVPVCQNALDLITQKLPPLSFSDDFMNHQQQIKDPIESALFTLAEFSDYISPDSPGFLNRMYSFIGKVFDIHDVFKYDYSNTDIMDVATKLNVPHIENCSRKEIISRLCQHCLFPCIYSRYHLSSLEESVVQHHNCMLQAVQNHVRVKKLKSKVHDHDLIRRYGENIDIYIPREDKVLGTTNQNTPNNNPEDTTVRFLPERNHSNMISALTDLFDNDNNIELFQFIKDSRLKHTQQLCDKFLCPNGMNHPHFLLSLTVESLMTYSQDKIKTQSERVLQVFLSCAAFHKQKNIAYSDIPNSRFFIYFYHLQKDKVIIFHKTIPVGGRIFPKVECEYIERTDRKLVSLCKCVLSNDPEQCHIRDAVRVPITNITTDHPRKKPNEKKPKRAKSIEKAINILLSSKSQCEHDHFLGSEFPSDDYLDIRDFTHEAVAIGCKLSDMFDCSLTSYLEEEKNVRSMNDFANLLYEEEGANESETEKTLLTRAIGVVSITCLKYKICFAIHSGSRTQNPKTRFLYFHPHTKKVCMLTEDMFCVLKGHPQFLYIRYVNPKLSQYWDSEPERSSPKLYSGLHLIQCHMSYLSEDNKEKILNFFRNQLHMIIIDESQTQALQTQNLHGLPQPIIIPKTMRDKQENLLEHSLVVVYPLNSEGFFDVGLVCNSTTLRLKTIEVISEEIHTLMTSVLENTTHKGYQLEMMTYSSIDVCSSYNLLLHIYLTKGSETCKELFKKVDKILETDSIICHCKNWIVSILSQYYHSSTTTHNVNNWIEERLIDNTGL